MKTFFNVVCLIVLTISTFSQDKVINTLSTKFELNQIVLNEINTYNDIDEYYSPFQYSNPTNTGNSVVFGGESFLLAGEKQNAVVIAFAANLKQKWATNLRGTAEYIGLLENKIVVITNDRKNYNSLKTEKYLGYIIDPTNGKIQVEKTILNTGKKILPQILFFFEKNSNRFHLAVRSNAMVKSPSLLSNSLSEKQHLITQWQQFEFDNNLNSVNETVFEIPEGAAFLSAVQIAPSQFAISTIDPNQKTTLRVFKPGTQAPLKTINLAIDYRSNRSHIGRLITNPEDNQLLHFVTFYENNEKESFYTLVNINLSNNQTASKTQKLGKDYKQYLSKNITEKYFKRDNKIENPENLLLMNCFIHKGDVYLISGFADQNSGTSDVGSVKMGYTIKYAGNLVVTAFSGFEPTERFTLVLPRRYHNSTKYGLSIFPLIENDILHIFADDSFKLTIERVHYRIDLKTGIPLGLSEVSKTGLPSLSFLNGSYCFRNDKTITLVYLSSPTNPFAYKNIFHLQQLIIK